MHYPPPSNALTVWMGDTNTLCVAIPGTRNSRGHTIKLSADLNGVNFLLDLLRRRKGTAEADQTIGTKAAPTQYDLREVSRRLLTDEQLRKQAEKQAKREAERLAADAFFKELGVTFDE